MTPLSYFLNETMLFGALAAAAPWLIHLINRARYSVQGWGAMLFLQESVEARAQSIKIRQWILLSLRSLFFFLLAIAMARPITHPGTLQASSKGAAVTHVLVIDTSCSTHYGNADNRVFDLIRQSAVRITREMNGGDTMLIIRAGGKAIPLFRNPVGDKDFLLRKVKDIKAGYGSANLVEATIQALHLLSETRTSKHRIHILTDNQAVNWPAKPSVHWQGFQRLYGLQKVKPEIYIIPHALPSTIPNIQVVRLKQEFPIVDIYRRNRFTVEIRNDGPPKRTRVDFYSGSQLESEREVDLDPGITEVTFDATFNTPGSHYVRASIPGDYLMPDNTTVLGLNVVKQIPVLLIEGRSAQDPLRSDGGCLLRALNPSGTDSDESLIAITTRNQTVIDEIDAAFLSNFKSVILANVSSLSTRFRSRLQHFVRLGGGVFICLGPGIDVDNYNILFKGESGLLPCLLETQSPVQRPPAAPLFHTATASDIFTSLTVGSDTIFDTLRVNRFHHSQPSSDAQVLASCNDYPLLLKKGFGKGQAIVWTSTANGDWNNFPFTDNYLPIIQNIVVYLSSNIRPPTNLSLNETLLFSATVDRTSVRGYSQPKSAILTKPDAEKTELPITFDDGRWLARYEKTSEPGLYSISFNEQAPTYYAVNLDKEEGKLAPLPPESLEQVEADLRAAFLSNVDAVVKINQQAASAGELWHVFIILALIVLGVEQFLGYTFK